MSWHLTVNKILLSISLGKKNKRKLPIEELTTTEDKYLGKELFRNGRKTQSHFKFTHQGGPQNYPNDEFFTYVTKTGVSNTIAPLFLRLIS